LAAGPQVEFAVGEQRQGVVVRQPGLGEGQRQRFALQLEAIAAGAGAEAAAGVGDQAAALEPEAARAVAQVGAVLQREPGAGLRRDREAGDARAPVVAAAAELAGEGEVAVGAGGAGVEGEVGLAAAGVQVDGVGDQAGEAEIGGLQAQVAAVTARGQASRQRELVGAAAAPGEVASLQFGGEIGRAGRPRSDSSPSRRPRLPAKRSASCSGAKRACRS
jgi:hypothetical protein